MKWTAKAYRIERLGVTPNAVRFQKLTADRLADALVATLRTQEYRRTAATVAERIAVGVAAGRGHRRPGSPLAGVTVCRSGRLLPS